MKKNVSGQKVGAQLVSAADGSAFTGSVTAAVTGDAGAQATGSVGSGACTHEGNGYHTYAPAQAETNYDLIAFTFTGTGAIPVTVQVYTGFPQGGDAYAETQNGTYGLAALETLVDGVENAVTAIEADTQDIQSRLPAALTGDGNIKADTLRLGGTLQTGRDIGASVLLSPGTGTGQISLSSGTVTLTDASLTSAKFGAGAITAAAIAADAITDAKVAADVTIASVGSVTGNVGGNVAGSVGSVTAGVTLAASAVQAIWDALTSALTAVGSIGKLLVDNINATISSRLASASYTAPDNSGIASAAASAASAAADAATASTQASGANTKAADLQTRVPTALTGAGNMKADALAISGSTESADRLERGTLGTTLLTCAAGGSATSIIASSLSPASAVNDQWSGQVVAFDKDTATAALRGQKTTITNYDHATLTFTVESLTTAPASGDTAVIG